MDDIPENKILDSKTIKLLNKTIGAAKLDESGKTTYILKFMFNDKMNQATDPMPFQIVTEALDKIADSGIGRPYVFNPGIKNNVGEHVRGPEDDPKKIVEFQKKFALGLIEGKYRTSSNNVYGIINVFPEHVDDISSGNIPLPTSPLLEPLKMVGNVIYDANMLHLQAVPSSGYPMELTSQLGVCKGMLDECSTQLRTLGSSRQLKKFQNQFSYSENTLGSSKMPIDQTGGPDAGGQMSVDDMVKKHDSMLADHGKMLDEHGKTLGSVSAQLSDVLKAVQGKNDQNYPGTNGSKAPSSGAGTYGSAGLQELITIPKEEFENLKKNLDEIKTLHEAEQKEAQTQREQAELKERERFAKVIAEGEVVIKEITKDKVPERIKAYINLKDGNGKLVDLSLLADKFGKMVKTLGSSREEDDSRFPSLVTVGASKTEDSDRALLLSMTDKMEDVS